MSDLLFDVPEQLSPKAAWMKKHGIETEHFPQFEGADLEDDFGNPIKPWICHVTNPDTGPLVIRETACADTEDEALAEWARKNEVLLWNEEQLLGSTMKGEAE